MFRKILLAFVAILAVVAVATGVAWYGVHRPIRFADERFEIVVRPGATLSSVAREMEQRGVAGARWMPLLARATGKDRSLKAGRYSLEQGLSLVGMLDVFVTGRVEMSTLAVIEGWTFARLKEAIRANPDVEKTAIDRSDAELLQLIGARESHPEGLFLPDTYLFASGTTDLVLLRRAYQALQQRLTAAWAERAPDLPYRDPYEALIMASIVERETGRPEDRPLVASVFVNRLRLGMKLQTDPTVIYGLGDAFDGNLRRRDLETDGPYNTYTRAGLPPTPIALPGSASIEAALKPPTTRYLYFVARGDGSSHFSGNLGEHNRAVDRYQRVPARAGSARTAAGGPGRADADRRGAADSRDGNAAPSGVPDTGRENAARGEKGS